MHFPCKNYNLTHTTFLHSIKGKVNEQHKKLRKIEKNKEEETDRSFGNQESFFFLYKFVVDVSTV